MPTVSRFVLSIGIMLLASQVACTHSASAQERPALPDGVARLIDRDTLLVARLDPGRVEATVVALCLKEWIDVVPKTAPWTESFRRLAAAGRKEVFVLLATTDLGDGPLLFVPASDREQKSDALKKSLEPFGAAFLETTPHGFLVGPEVVRERVRSLTPVARPEFATALEAVRQAALQIAIVPGPDARRVLREFSPFDATDPQTSLGKDVADGVAWLAGGITASPHLDIKAIVHAKDAASAESLQRSLNGLIGQTLAIESLRELLPNAERLAKLFALTRDGSRLTLLLNEANGGAKSFATDVIEPLAKHFVQQATQRRIVNNLQQMALAMHTYHDVAHAFPPAAQRAADGKKLLSWRVLILPYLDQNELFKKFHLDEPWDSDHNRTLIPLMPNIYASGQLPAAAVRQGKTNFVVPIGEKTVFANAEGMPIKKITDGTEHTIMILAAHPDRAVIWTKPEDLSVDMKQPHQGLTGQPGGLFRACLCDGAVRIISDTIDAANLRRLLQASDGEKIE